MLSSDSVQKKTAFDSTWPGAERESFLLSGVSS